MCLFTNGKAKVKVAEENLTFYKVLIKEPADIYTSERLVTPYMATVVKLGTLYEEKTKRFKENTKIIGWLTYSWYDEGMFHLYANYQDALRLFTRIQYQNNEPTIVKAIVPKGTKYIEGRTECNEPTIGAKAVRYEAIKEE